VALDLLAVLIDRAQEPLAVALQSPDMNLSLGHDGAGGQPQPDHIASVGDLSS
jgi:hypothetical protein